MGPMPLGVAFQASCAGVDGIECAPTSWLSESTLQTIEAGSTNEAVDSIISIGVYGVA